MKIIKNSFCALLLLSFSLSFSQTFSAFDHDKNSRIDRTEFLQEYSAFYPEWDIDKNGNVDDSEFYQTLFIKTDKNKDHNFSEEEWGHGYKKLFGDFLGTPDPGQFDVNLDKKISEKEFYSGMKHSDFYSVYDSNTDKNLDVLELGNSVFDTWDENRDEAWDKAEFKAFISFHGL